mmetsp:Transcript_34391/g.53659  ORF Transcript_34391/g.53659 Transcript_34391/m.53659 type:complete len:109 (-) Transcript_34391:838-1164(-)
MRRSSFAEVVTGARTVPRVPSGARGCCGHECQPKIVRTAASRLQIAHFRVSDAFFFFYFVSGLELINEHSCHSHLTASDAGVQGSPAPVVLGVQSSPLVRCHRVSSRG